MTIQTINKDMKEPEDEGAYIVTRPDGSQFFTAHKGRYWDVGEPSLWDEVQYWFDGFSIESLAEHDARIRREALTATDEELAVMEAAFDTSINDREDDGIGAMGIAMKALAESREAEGNENGEI